VIKITNSLNLKRLKNWKYLGAFLGMIGGIIFIIGTIIIMIIYPGGYSFTENYFSELGHTVSVSNGQDNMTNFVLFAIICTVLAIFLVPFMLSLRTVFTENKASLYISTLGTVLGIIAAPFLSLFSLLPPDLFMEEHTIATRILFLFLALTIIVYSIAILFNERYEKIYAYLGFAIGIYVMVHLLVLMYNVVSQKFTVYIMITWFTIQGFKLWKVLE